MSMLAEPRRKQKIINLRAKNNAWSNDSSKFGQRMLEKMGWTSGKGLGAKENGIVDHVIARYKNDDKGLGYEDKNDQWTKHEDDFNSLLANLSNEKDTSSEVLHSGVSLEVKSKKSKARIHYHKFTRGKDISRYSEKDLANIFGKKTFKSENVQETIKDNVETTEQVFTEKGSMEDYFKSKMATLKSKNKIPALEHNENYDVAFRGFSGTNDEDINENIETEEHSFYKTKNQEISQEDPTETVSKKLKKKKFKTKAVFNNENVEKDFNFQGFSGTNVLTDDSVTKINCDDVFKSSGVEENNELTEVNNMAECILPKKNKKKKKKSKDDDFIKQESGNIIHEIVVTKKPKKKKNKDINIEITEGLEEQTCDTRVKRQKCDSQDDGASKKKKKRINKDL